MPDKTTAFEENRAAVVPTIPFRFHLRGETNERPTATAATATVRPRREGGTGPTTATTAFFDLRGGRGVSRDLPQDYLSLGAGAGAGGGRRGRPLRR